MTKKKDGAFNVSGKPKHSLDVNRSNGLSNKGTRSAGNVRRLKMYNTRPKRHRKGKILKHELQSKDLPKTRLEPDRRWFGNTRVLNQKEFEFFREELQNRLSSNYDVILKERKLPLSLLNDHQKDGYVIQEEEAELNIEPFSRVVNSNPEENSDDEGYDFDGFLETLSEHDLGIEEINEEDEVALAVYFGSDAGPQLTLADIIIKKIKEKDLQASSEERPMPKFDDGIIDVYRRVGNVLSRYTSGKVPKALQHIAIMERWEEVLYITEPEKWSPNAMYQATRIFASRFNPKRAQRFYKLVLLPRVREEIQKNKRLHRAIYEAVKKSLYKPAGFFKGILFPLCQSQTCTLIEAHIIGSIIQKVSIPSLHSSVALMTLAGMEYYGTTSFFIKLLIEKKYALPYRILDALVAHFMRFLEDKRAMPVIWHQTLLAFVQRYKNELTKVDKNNLDRLMHHQKHYLVTPEICRELKNSRHRGEKEDITLQAPLIYVINKPIKEDRWDIPDVSMEED